VPAGPLALLKTENGQERLVDSPHFLSTRMFGEVSEPGGVDGADLLDEDLRCLVLDDDLGPKRCRSSASRSGRHQDDSPWQQFVSLDDYAESLPSLLMAAALRPAKLIDVTSAHADPP